MRRGGLLLACLALTGCGGTIAKDRAGQGAPCEAAELHEGTQAEQAQFASECTAQKDREAATKEAKRTDEAIREGERLKREGKSP